MDTKNYSEEIFENLKHINEYGQEFWYARELQSALEYSQWRYLKEAIERAKSACVISGQNITDHFAEVRKMVEIGSNAKREIEDIALSRYACYLIVMNGDPRKEIIALGQTYFAVKTRQQELIEDYDRLSEEQKRLAIRNEMKRHNSALANAAQEAGVKQPIDFAIFQNYGYMGLYNGLKAQDIKERKGLKKNQDILDYMGSTELGGTMPEDLPTPEKSVRQIERENKTITEK